MLAATIRDFLSLPAIRVTRGANPAFDSMHSHLGTIGWVLEHLFHAEGLRKIGNRWVSKGPCGA